MRDKVERWVKQKAVDIRETSQELSLSAKNACETVRRTVSGLEIPKGVIPHRKERGPVEQETPVDVMALRRALTGEMERAVHRAYYKDGGFRFFACELQQFVALQLNHEEELQRLWAGVYNSNIRFLVEQTEKLEQELETMVTARGLRPLPLKNEDLLRQMQTFANRAKADRLDQQNGWQAEDYREAAQRYASDLNMQLLEHWRQTD